MKGSLFPILMLPYLCLYPVAQSCRSAGIDEISFHFSELNLPVHDYLSYASLQAERIAGLLLRVSPDKSPVRENTAPPVQALSQERSAPAEKPSGNRIEEDRKNTGHDASTWLLIRTVLIFLLIILLFPLYYFVRMWRAARRSGREKNGDEDDTRGSGSNAGSYGSNGAKSNHVSDGPGGAQKSRSAIGNAETDKLPPTDREIELTLCIHRMMVESQMYRECDLTLETIARRLSVSRESVSRAINRSTKKNFPRFLNEYRIREAIHRLSGLGGRAVNFDDLSEQVGFNNRTSFHRAFKQITGVSPSVFKCKR